MFIIQTKQKLKHLLQGTALLLVVVLFIFALVDVAETNAAINSQLNYQGKLSDSSGNQVTDGTYYFKFSIYDASSGGTELWTETWNNTTTAVSTVNGVFSVALGTHATLSNLDFNTEDLYLQVYLDANKDGTFEETFSTRKRLTATPYAFNAEKINGFSATNTAAVANALIALDASKTLNLFDGGVSSTNATSTSLLVTGQANVSRLFATTTAFDTLSIFTQLNSPLLFATTTYFDNATTSNSLYVGNRLTVGGTNATSTFAGNISIANGKNLQVSNIFAYSPLTIGTDVNITGYATSTTGLFSQGNLRIGGTATIDGTVTLNTALGVTSGGTGSTTAAGARTNLGLAIGSDIQAYNANLASIAAGTWTGTTSITTLGTIATGTWSATEIAVAKGGTGATTAANARTNLGLAIGSDIQAYNANLAAIAAGTWTGASSVTTLGTIATGTWSATEIAVAKGGTGATTAANARTNLGLAIGSDIQAYNANLAAIAAGTWTGATSITTLGTITTGTWSGTTIALDKGGTGTTSFGANRIPFINSGNTAFTSAADFIFDGSTFTLGTVTTAADRTLKVLAGNSNQAGIEIYGNGTGTGYIFVGDSNDTGGGMFYAGDATPSFGATGQQADALNIYKNFDGTKTTVMYIPWSSSLVYFNTGLSSTSYYSNTDATIYIDNDNNGSNSFTVNANNGTNVFTVAEASATFGVSSLYFSPEGGLGNFIFSKSDFSIRVDDDDDDTDSFNILGSGGSLFYVSESGDSRFDTQVGINIDPSDAYAITLPNTGSNTPGNQTGYGVAKGWIDLSDSRIKSSQRELDYGLEELLQIVPKRYTHHDSRFENGHLIIGNGSETIGLIAQELINIIPEAVMRPSRDSESLWGVDYDKLIPVIIKSIQEQQKKIDEILTNPNRYGGTVNEQPSKLKITADTMIVSQPVSLSYTLMVEEAAEFYGTLYVYGPTGFAHKVVFESDIEVKGKVYTSKDQAGSAVIPMGYTFVDVKFEKEYEGIPKVIANLTGDDENPIFINWIITKRTTKGFTINIASPQYRDIVFDWIALAVKGDTENLTEKTINNPDSGENSNESSQQNDDSQNEPPASDPEENNDGSEEGNNNEEQNQETGDENASDENLQPPQNDNNSDANELNQSQPEQQKDPETQTKNNEQTTQPEPPEPQETTTDSKTTTTPSQQPENTPQPET